ncbi:MAG: hypothetical protein DRP14_02690 [Candidatus Aenigmatarchaeota archaeon]|nr:MAG: hypothetical protein DRP14_02690 [Candidatus Aenigmarchaeota archaeon]
MMRYTGKPGIPAGTGAKRIACGLFVSTHQQVWQKESNPRPFSVWGKCGEKHFPRRDAKNGTLKLSRHCK